MYKHKTKTGWIIHNLFMPSLFTYKLREIAEITTLTGREAKVQYIEIRGEGQCCLSYFEADDDMRHSLFDGLNRQKLVITKGHAFFTCATQNELEQIYPHLSEKQVSYIKKLIAKGRIKFLIPKD